MPATADAQGRIKCQHCSNTLLWLSNGMVRWDAHIGSGRKRVFAFPDNHPSLKDLVVVCERCGSRWVPTFTDGGPIPAPANAGVIHGARVERVA